MKILRIIKRIIFKIVKDIKARVHLKKIVLDRKRDKVIKVGFIVQLPEIWDKQVDVFEKMLNDEAIETYLIVVPSFDFEKNKFNDYGFEKYYFENHYKNIVEAISPEGKVIDIKSYDLDYVFYQRPYDVLLPKELRSCELVKITKICHIPYGFIGANIFSNKKHREFYRNVYIGFMDSKDESESMNKAFKNTVKKKYQKFVDLGYPVLEKFLSIKPREEVKEILWTPRWTYDAEVGGSNFIEYKDKIIKLGTLCSGLHVTIRPHPLTFSNMIKEGKMTEEDVEIYKDEVKKNNVSIDKNEFIEDSIKNTDILVTDFSSIMIMYFLTGKPMIYCKCDLELNDAYKKMMGGVYVAENWEQVEEYIKEIYAGNDYLKEKREEIIRKEFSTIRNSANKIVDFIKKDYMS